MAELHVWEWEATIVQDRAGTPGTGDTPIQSRLKLFFLLIRELTQDSGCSCAVLRIATIELILRTDAKM